MEVRKIVRSRVADSMARFAIILTSCVAIRLTKPMFIGECALNFAALRIDGAVTISAHEANTHARNDAGVAIPCSNEAMTCCMSGHIEKHRGQCEQITIATRTDANTTILPEVRWGDGHSCDAIRQETFEM